MNLTAGLLRETLGEAELDWLVLTGGFLRDNFHPISLIEFIPQTFLNLLVIVSTISTIYTVIFINNIRDINLGIKFCNF